MSDEVKVFRCDVGGHEWSRPASMRGSASKFCPEHRPAVAPSKTFEARIKAAHLGSDVTAAEVVEWVRSLGFDVQPNLRGWKADVLVARYNREHPDRPYVRAVA